MAAGTLRAGRMEKGACYRVGLKQIIGRIQKHSQRERLQSKIGTMDDVRAATETVIFVSRLIGRRERRVLTDGRMTRWNREVDAVGTAESGNT